MGEDISPISPRNVTGESSSKFKLVVNAYGCFVESDEHNEGHKIRQRLKPGEIFLRPDSTVKCFDSLIYYFVQFLGSLGMCSRKNEREVVLAKRRISTAYTRGGAGRGGAGRGGGGVLLGIFGGRVPPGSSNPDPISDQKMLFSTSVFRLDL